MSLLDKLEPKSVFAFFEKMCAIPHGSENVDAISDWLVDFAKTRNLKYIQDEAKNVIIFKAASKGYENAPVVILQGHMDMVCEEAPDCEKNMEREGLDLLIDGDFLTADGTTLGGDDGIAVAMVLSILDSDLPAPAIEAVFTTDEETGMNGAMSIDTSVLKGKTMINIDSEDEGVFTVSCAGGNRAHCRLPVERECCNSKAFRITVKGLTGGHSGIEINKGGANANTLLARLLFSLSQRTGIRLSSINGGKKDNAIPIVSEAVIFAEDEALMKEICSALEKEYKNEYAVSDPELEVVIESAEADTALDKASFDKVLCMLNNLPNGIYAMSQDVEGLVQTSLNLGILETTETSVNASYCVRSSIESQKRMLDEKIICLMNQLGGYTEIVEDYPGWQYQKESRIRDLMAEVYEEQSGKKPKIEAIHAGVECGLFSGKIKDLDCISIGPDLFDVHTFNERLSIPSTGRTYALIVETLKRMK